MPLKLAPFCLALVAASGMMVPFGAAHAQTGASATATDPFATFVPSPERKPHRIDYSICSYALSQFVISMGPSIRKKPKDPVGPIGTRIRMGHNSLYRLEGSMVAFSFMDEAVVQSFTDYRRELEELSSSLDIQSLPRNEQLAYWLNLHNVAMVEQVAKVWPVRQPHEIEIDGVPLDEARFITVEGVALSPRDIRERIVYANWRDPRVIYGLWRAEIGGPAMRREAFDGRNVADQLERAAREFVNSMRGTEKRGTTLHVSSLYAEASPHYFPDLETGLRAHLTAYANAETQAMIAGTGRIEADLAERDIADLAGGSRSNAFFSSGRLGVGVAQLLAARAAKMDYIERKGLRSGSVTFSNIDLPGDPPNKGEVE